MNFLKIVLTAILTYYILLPSCLGRDFKPDTLVTQKKIDDVELKLHVFLPK